MIYLVRRVYIVDPPVTGIREIEWLLERTLTRWPDIDGASVFAELVDDAIKDRDRGSRRGQQRGGGIETGSNRDPIVVAAGGCLAIEPATRGWPDLASAPIDGLVKRGRSR